MCVCVGGGCYRHSGTRQRGTADSRHDGRSASQVGRNRANVHTPVVPAHTAAELEEMKGGADQTGGGGGAPSLCQRPEVNRSTRRTAAVLVFSTRAVGDAVTAQDGRDAEVIQTAVKTRRTAILRRGRAGDHRRTLLFIRAVHTVKLPVAPPALRDALEGVRTPELVRTAGQRARGHESLDTRTHHDDDESFHRFYITHTLCKCECSWCRCKNELYLRPYTPACRRRRPQRCLSTCLRPPRPGKSP